MFVLNARTLSHYTATNLEDALAAVKRDLSLQGYQNVWLSVEEKYRNVFVNLAAERGWVLSGTFGDSHKAPSNEELRIKILTVEYELDRGGLRIIRNLIADDEMVILVTPPIDSSSRLVQEPDNYITVVDGVVTYEKTRYQLLVSKTVELKANGNGNVEII